MAKGFAVMFCWLVAATVTRTRSMESAYVSGADYQFQENADLVAEQWCVNYPVGTIDLERGHKELKNGVGGHNFFWDVLSTAESPEEVQSGLQHHLQNGRLYFKAFPIVLALLLSLVWLILCCACACCDKRNEKPPLTQRGHKVCTGMASVLVFLVLLGVVACTWAAARGSDKVTAGLENSLCSSAEFINTTFAGSQGQGDTKFMGILPTLVSFEDLEKKLDTDSTFLSEIDRLLNETSKINDAVTIASATLQLLQDTLDSPDNKEPKTSGGASLYHNSLLSESLPAALSPVIEALSSGVAVALADARAEAESQLSEARRQELQASLRESITPLTEQKDSLRTMLEGIINPDHRTEWWDKGTLALKASTLGLCTLACLIVLFAISSIVCCSGTDARSTRQRRSLACCSWCCSIYLAILAFFVGGFMLVVAVPVSGGCLLVDGIDSQKLHDIAPAIPGLHLEGDNGIMISDMLDKCINPVDPSVPANLLDILFLRNETTGEKTTMREMFIDTMKDQIESKFAVVAEQMAIDVPPLAENLAIISLRDLLRTNPADTMLIPNEAMQSTSPYNKLVMVPSLAQVAFNSSAACGIHVANLPGVSTAINGISQLLTELEALGSSPTVLENGLSCTQTVTCNSGATEEACEAGNALMSLKAELQGKGGYLPYKCNLFRSPPGAGSATCDVKNMAQMAPNSIEYTGDCLQADGTMSEETVSCDLANFTAYLADFDRRIDMALRRIDATVEVLKSDINVTMRRLLDQEILQPLDEMAGSMNCNYLGTLYDGLVQSMCYQGAHGFRIIAVSYVALGFLQLVLICVMFAIHLRGRRDISKDEAGTVRRDAIDLQV